MAKNSCINKYLHFEKEHATYSRSHIYGFFLPATSQKGWLCETRGHDTLPVVILFHKYKNKQKSYFSAINLFFFNYNKWNKLENTYISQTIV